MSRKLKWKGVHLNNKNIDEYMDDLYNDTKGQYITQGVSFNKDDNFQMNLLKNALLSHGSFSGFIKHLMYSHFERNNRLDESIWLPNSNEFSPPPAPTQESKNDNPEQVVEVTQEFLVQDDAEEQDNPVSPAPIQQESQDGNSVGQQINTQRKRKIKIKGGGSLNDAILNNKQQWKIKNSSPPLSQWGFY